MSNVGQQGAHITELSQGPRFWEDSNILNDISHCTRNKITLEDPKPRRKYLGPEGTHITFAQNSPDKTSSRSPSSPPLQNLQVIYWQLKGEKLEIFGKLVTTAEINGFNI